MRLGIALAALLAIAANVHAADPIYIDQLMETPLARLQQTWPNLKSDGCYRLVNGQYLHVTIDKKDEKPWRVTLAADAPCRRAEQTGDFDIQSRSGIKLGDTTIAIVERLGRPDASAAPEAAQKRLGETEYFYICRVSEGCARHTSLYVRDGRVTAISEWYSE